MPKLIANHARPIAQGVTTMMAVSGDPVADQSTKELLRDALVAHLDTPLAFAGAASLLGSKKPVFWALIGLGVSLYVNR